MLPGTPNDYPPAPPNGSFRVISSVADTEGYHVGDCGVIVDDAARTNGKLPVGEHRMVATLCFRAKSDASGAVQRISRAHYFPVGGGCLTEIWIAPFAVGMESPVLAIGERVSCDRATGSIPPPRVLEPLPGAVTAGKVNVWMGACHGYLTDAARYVTHALHYARAVKDIVQLNCLHDKQTQLVVLARMVEARLSDVAKANATDDDRRHQLLVSKVACDRGAQLQRDAAQCVGYH